MTTDIKDVLKHIGIRIRNARKNKGYSQENLADCISVDHTMVSRYERGVTDIPVSKLVRICDECGFEPRSFFSWRTDGLDELQKLLEDCVKLSGAEEGVRDTDKEKIELSEEAKDLLMAYQTLQSNPAIPKATLKKVRESIVPYIEIEQKSSREALYKRLKAYSRGIEEMSKKK